jgi:hypothetical protein
MKEIKLTKGQITLVDDEDYDFLNKWKWDAILHNNNYIVSRYDKESYKHNKKIKTIYMSRVIMKTPRNLECDHVFHNTLDNRKFIEVNGELKQNLRNCTHSNNCVNRKQPTSTGYRGVTFHKATDKYMVQLKAKGKRYYLGVFTDIIEAAKKYDKHAIKHFGEFATLNFKE